MKSGSWSSRQAALPSEARAGGEPDNTPIKPPPMMPATMTPGKRFAEKTGFTWDIYDWMHEACSCVGKVRGENGEPLADPSCPICKGSGSDPVLVPDLIASGLFEEDARMLVFGPDLLDALEGMNHMGGDDRGGYCICPKNDGSAPDEQHATSCADARKSIRAVRGTRP